MDSFVLESVGKLGLAPDLAIRPATGGPDRAFSFRDPAGYAAFVAQGIEGIRFAVPENRRNGLVKLLQRQLGSQFTVYFSQQNFGRRPDELTVLATADRYDALRFEGCNGLNHGHYTEDVIAHLRQLDQEYPFDLLGVGFDFMEGEFWKTPADPRRLAERMYQFCPDIVNQGTRTVQALADALDLGIPFYYWWD